MEPSQKDFLILLFLNYTEVGNGGASRRQLCTIISKLETWKEFLIYLPRHQTVHIVDAKPLANMGTGMRKAKSIRHILIFFLKMTVFKMA